MRGAAAAAAGDNAVAAQAYETLLSSGRLAGADEQRTTAALAGIYFQQKNYAQAIKVAQRYQKSGGSDPDMRTLLVQSYYLSNDCGNVVSLLKPAVDAQVRARPCARRVATATARHVRAACKRRHDVPRHARKTGCLSPEAVLLGRSVSGDPHEAGLFVGARYRHLSACVARPVRSRPSTTTWR